ncbi:hypothetical protein BTO02_26300 [Paraburkholderia sp. SOS3]|nr:hypothetical protein BTO02_26300 [Paraburkholderia sp. SOS3]
MSQSSLERTWVEVKLSENDRLAYPLRTPPNAMLGGSVYEQACSPEKASFKLRYATFSASDIANGFDPNYDKVGPYIDIPSTSALEDYFVRENLDLEGFVDSGLTDYPM